MSLENIESGISKVVGAISSVFELDDTNVKVHLELDGMSYEVAHFYIDFKQEIDYKGQPQQETSGGKIHLTLTQTSPSNIDNWAMRATKRKDGVILFTTETSGTILNIGFENANCVNLFENVDDRMGATTTFVIAPEFVKMGDTTHDNRWRSE